MDQEKFFVQVGASLIIIAAVLTFMFRESKNGILALIVFFGTLIGAILLLLALTETEVKWVKIVSKVFFIIPLLATTVFLLYGIFFAFLVIIGLLSAYLFLIIDKKKHVILKILAWIIGILTYLMIAITLASFIYPWSLGTFW